MGRLAEAIMSAARLIMSRGAGNTGSGVPKSGTASVAGASATSSGRSRCTGPLGSVIAIRMASASGPATLSCLSAKLALVIGANSA